MSNYSAGDRNIPVRPDLDQLKHQAKDLLKHVRANDAAAIEEFTTYHPKQIEPADAILADAQLALARAYGVKSWPRLVQACDLIDAIWRDDLTAVRELVTKHPNLIHENARATEKCNWGPPMSYAANLGRNEIIKMLAEMGATDFEHALDRAALQGKIDTAEMLHGLLGSPLPPDGALGGTAYTLSESGTAFALRAGARVVDENGKRLAPVDVVLETDSRNPTAKHAILEMYAANGLELPDTPVMALHRGRIDLLEEHVLRDPSVLNRTFTHEEIYPPDLGCHDEVLATQGTPLAGTTLLHLCVDYDEFEIAEWLIAKGADVNARAAVEANGFGGHTPLFCTVVSQPNFWMNYQGREQEARFAELLLNHGADVSIRASLRKKLHPGYAPKYDVENWYEYLNVTALEWGEQFHAKVFVSEPAMELIARTI
ncbi:MAG: ankyrin repeat domain-containing protein [Acidobacteria bacterium]|nr:ankyrin repeat domain-containing protein [Acidobacteriota bacterium]